MVVAPFLDSAPVEAPIAALFIGKNEIEFACGSEGLFDSERLGLTGRFPIEREQLLVGGEPERRGFLKNQAAVIGRLTGPNREEVRASVVVSPQLSVRQVKPDGSARIFTGRNQAGGRCAWG